VLWNQWSFLVLFSVIHFGCWWEYLRLTEKIHNTTFHFYTKLGLMLMGYGLMIWFCGPSLQLFGYTLKQNFSLPVSGAGFILLIIGIFQKNTVLLKAFGMALLGLVYISLSWGLMMDLRNTYIPPNDKLYFSSEWMGLIFPCAVILSLWINDTMAYLVGSLIGKTPLTKISPKKTWEGTIGGIVLCIGIIALLGWREELYTIGDWICIATIAAVTGTSGDLLESKLKRLADVKDSGTLMPGHGGFLDRFDSLLVATPFVWLYVQLFLEPLLLSIA
jgi:phosphatidate cytidylyltransferase